VGATFGASHVVDVLQGVDTVRVVENAHDGLSVFGKASDVSRKRLAQIIRQMRADGYLDVEPGGGSLVLTEDAWPLIKGSAKVTLAGVAPVFGGAARPAVDAPAAIDLPPVLRELVALRGRLAAESGCEPASIVGDRTIERMASARPTNRDDFTALVGKPEEEGGRLWERFSEILSPAVGLRPQDPALESFSLF
jgi:ATP-dependent DNA helicase RecQ